MSLDVALSWGTTQTAVATVRMDQRTEGRSGYTFRTLIRHTLNMVLGYSVAPLRLVTYVGLLIGAAGLLIFARLLWLYYRGQTTIAGFTTLASMIALFSSAQLVAVGVLGEYVGRVHLHGMGRPTYVIRERAGEGTPEEIGPCRLTSRAEPVPPRQSGEPRLHASQIRREPYVARGRRGPEALDGVDHRAPRPPRSGRRSSGSRTSRSATSSVTGHPPGPIRPNRCPAGASCNGW